MQTKIIATAMGAFGLGALIGWAVTADIYESRYKRLEVEFDEAIGEKTRHIWALQDRAEAAWAHKSPSFHSEDFDSPTNEVNVESSQMAFDEIEEDNVDESKEVPEGETLEETRTNLQKIIDAYTSNPESQEEFTEIVTRSIENDKAPPFVISKATYTWDEEGENYAKITLTYFPDDRVLLDDDEDPIIDVARYVGWRSLSQFGGESEDPNVVFVRNRRMMTDFEVVKEEDVQLPLHVKYGMEKEEFRVNRAAGLIKLRQEDDDH